MRRSAEKRTPFIDPESVEGEYLVRLYETAATPLDRLPYTAAFDTLVRRYRLRHGDTATHHDLFLTLMQYRKLGALPCLFR